MTGYPWTVARLGHYPVDGVCVACGRTTTEIVEDESAAVAEIRRRASLERSAWLN